MKKYFLLGLFAFAMFFSCRKELVNNNDLQIGSELKSEANLMVCLELVYPITYIMPNRSTITRDSEEKMNAAITRWYNANPNATVRPVLQFPVKVKFKGQPLTINSEQQMQRVKNACAGEVATVPCMELIYPITYIMPDRSAITRDSEEKMNAAITRWYNANPNATVRPVLQYPVNIKFKGKAQTIINEQQMQRIKNACK